MGILLPYFSSPPLKDSSERSNNLLNVWILFILYVITHTHTHARTHARTHTHKCTYVCSLLMSSNIYIFEFSYESNLNYYRHTLFPCYPTPYLATKLLSSVTLCQDIVTDYSTERENPNY